MKAFKYIAVAVESPKFTGDKEMTKMIVDFLPRLLEASNCDLYRSMVSDVILLVEGYETLWSRGVLPDKDYAHVHRHCEGYLDNYLDKTKRNMNGN